VTVVRYGYNANASMRRTFSSQLGNWPTYLLCLFNARRFLPQSESQSRSQSL